LKIAYSELGEALRRSESDCSLVIISKDQINAIVEEINRLTSQNIFLDPKNLEEFYYSFKSLPESIANQLTEVGGNSKKREQNLTLGEGVAFVWHNLLQAMAMVAGCPASALLETAAINNNEILANQFNAILQAIKEKSSRIKASPSALQPGASTFSSFSFNLNGKPVSLNGDMQQALATLIQAITAMIPALTQAASVSAGAASGANITLPASIPGIQDVARMASNIAAQMCPQIAAIGGAANVSHVAASGSTSPFASAKLEENAVVEDPGEVLNEKLGYLENLCEVIRAGNGDVKNELGETPKSEYPIRIQEIFQLIFEAKRQLIKPSEHLSEKEIAEEEKDFFDGVEKILAKCILEDPPVFLDSATHSAPVWLAGTECPAVLTPLGYLLAALDLRASPIKAGTPYTNANINDALIQVLQRKISAYEKLGNVVNAISDVAGANGVDMSVGGATNKWDRKKDNVRKVIAVIGNLDTKDFTPREENLENIRILAAKLKRFIAALSILANDLKSQSQQSFYINNDGSELQMDGWRKFVNVMSQIAGSDCTSLLGADMKRLAAEEVAGYMQVISDALEKKLHQVEHKETVNPAVLSDSADSRGFPETEAKTTSRVPLIPGSQGEFFAYKVIREKDAVAQFSGAVTYFRDINVDQGYLIVVQAVQEMLRDILSNEPLLRGITPPEINGLLNKIIKCKRDPANNNHFTFEFDFTNVLADPNFSRFRSELKQVEGGFKSNKIIRNGQIITDQLHQQINSALAAQKTASLVKSTQEVQELSGIGAEICLQRLKFKHGNSHWHEMPLSKKFGFETLSVLAERLIFELKEIKPDYIILPGSRLIDAAKFLPAKELTEMPSDCLLLRLLPEQQMYLKNILLGEFHKLVFDDKPIDDVACTQRILRETVRDYSQQIKGGTKADCNEYLKINMEAVKQKGAMATLDDVLRAKASQILEKIHYTYCLHDFSFNEETGLAFSGEMGQKLKQEFIQQLFEALKVRSEKIASMKPVKSQSSSALADQGVFKGDKDKSNASSPALKSFETGQEESQNFSLFD
jgi:hypothetical protein